MIELAASTGAYTPGRKGHTIQNIILHSSDGTLKGDLETLTHERSAHYYVSRDGRIYHLVADGDTAWHAGAVFKDEDSNASTIGIEQEHYDPGKEYPNGQDWPRAQIEATSRLVAYLRQKYGLSQSNIKSHSEIARPAGRKVDPSGYPWETFGALVASDLGGRESGEVAGGAKASAKHRMMLAAATHIMNEEGASGSQDGKREIYGFREGQDSEYPALARARAQGNEAEVRRIATQGLVNRAYAAGAGQFTDPAVKAYLMSASHMRGVDGAKAILNAAASGQLEYAAERIEPQNIEKINSMPIAKLMRRLEIVRNAYDQRFLALRQSSDEAGRTGSYWDLFGRGLQNRYQREREFYSALH